ncbi:hypothetical protein NMY22_g1583 [Coprinellus aureogranulatus]|nr:hypothetical protein NMY22_g1583 [Coprinellus aureogranulatus]
MPQSENTQRRAIEYNLIWMERTFKERSTTERLLAPELENGVLTQHDYDLAVTFLPGLHRHYNTFGTVIGAGASYAAQRAQPIPRATGRAAGIVFFGALTGRAIGSALAVYSHYRFIDQIRDPEGFTKAMENIQQRIGPSGPGILGSSQPVILKRSTEFESATSSSSASPDFPPVPDGFSQPQPVSDLVATTQNLSTSPSQPPQPPRETTWDRIRKANGNGVNQSSWDSIRQNHEKAQMQRRSPTQTQPDPFSDGSARYRDGFDRRDEQAKFDAMLEKERGFRG